MQRPTAHITRLLSLLVLCLAMLTVAACQDQAETETTGEEGVGEGTDMTEETPAYENTPAIPTNYFTNWDTDTDTYLSEEEFNAGLEAGDWWNEWDLDDDTYLNQDEFTSGLSSYGWYTDDAWDTWDLDQDDRISQDEFNAGLYDVWDANQDNQLALNEYDANLFD